MRASLIAPKDEVEDDEGHHDAEDTREGKIKPVCHHADSQQGLSHPFTPFLKILWAETDARPT